MPLVIDAGPDVTAGWVIGGSALIVVSLVVGLALLLLDNGGVVTVSPDGV